MVLLEFLPNDCIFAGLSTSHIKQKHLHDKMQHQSLIWINDGVNILITIRFLIYPVFCVFLQVLYPDIKHMDKSLPLSRDTQTQFFSCSTVPQGLQPQSNYFMYTVTGIHMQTFMEYA